MKKSIFFFFLVIQFASFFTKGRDKEQSRIRCAVDSQPLAGVFSGGKMDLGYPSGHEFFLLWERSHRRWIQDKEMEPLACATRDTILGLREIQRLVSRTACAWSQMNVGGINIPFILQNKHKEMKAHRYEAISTVAASALVIIGSYPTGSAWKPLWG